MRHIVKEEKGNICVTLNLLLPPSWSTPGYHPLKMEMGNDTLVCRAPSCFVDRRHCARILNCRCSKIDQIRAHNATLHSTRVVGEGSQAVKQTLILLSAICRVIVNFTKKSAEDASSQLTILVTQAGQHKPVSTPGVRLYRFKKFTSFC